MALYVEVGVTGIEISAIVFGAGAVFRGEPADRVETVRRALDAGVNWVDTAPSYGDGQSKENLGRILTELEASLRLSRKVRLAPDDLTTSPPQLAPRSIAASSYCSGLAPT